MRKILFTLLALVSFTALAQESPVEWKSKVKDNGNGGYTIRNLVLVEAFWRKMAQHIVYDKAAIIL